MRYALRQLRKSPSFTLTVIFTIALSIRRQCGRKTRRQPHQPTENSAVFMGSVTKIYTGTWTGTGYYNAVILNPNAYMGTSVTVLATGDYQGGASDQLRKGRRDVWDA